MAEQNPNPSKNPHPSPPRTPSPTPSPEDQGGASSGAATSGSDPIGPAAAARELVQDDAATDELAREHPSAPLPARSLRAPIALLTAAGDAWAERRSGIRQETSPAELDALADATAAAMEDAGIRPTPRVACALAWGGWALPRVIAGVMPPTRLDDQTDDALPDDGPAQ